MTDPLDISKFYSLVQATLEPRRRIVKSVLHNVKPESKDTAILEETYSTLDTIPVKDNGKLLLVNDKIIPTDLGYEMEELKRDLLFIKEGEDSFLTYLESQHDDFSSFIDCGLKYLDNFELNLFITDRDGTINNYCGRYLSSVQGVYNSVFISRFASKLPHSVILSSAPLDNGGLTDISVNPENHFIYAGSKGREYLTSDGLRGSLPIPAEKQKRLDELNIALINLINKSEFQVFGYIGSGLQFKFGQSTIARQDIYHSVADELSEHFLNVVSETVKKIDPREMTFRIEDTGKDIEVILTIEDGEKIKDFDKGDGVKYLDSELNLFSNTGSPLICGDTRSDLSMLEVSREKNAATKSIFVSTDTGLKKEIEDKFNDCLIVPSPDILVTILGELGKG